MAISKFNKSILVVNKQGLLGEKTPSFSCTGLTKQAFLSLSLERLFWLSSLRPLPAPPVAPTPRAACRPTGSHAT